MSRYVDVEASRDESIQVDNSNDHLVSSRDYVGNLVKNPGQRTVGYLRSLFPGIEWFPHYPKHLDWLLSDFITGVTVAIVLVPQSMSYAKLASLSPQFGLYSAFIGAMFYFMFATSREICIGPVAVLSMEVGKIVNRVKDAYGDEYTANEIATTLALVSGGIVLGIGLLRLGFIAEFISLPAIMAFTTGSAFNIVSGQLAGLMGYKKKVNSNGATYKTIIEFLKHLPDTKVDAAFGLVGLLVLYSWQYALEYLIKRNARNPTTRQILIYVLNLRTAFVIIISTCISFGVLRNNHAEKKPYSIIGVIPSGLNHVGKFTPPPGLVKRLASDLPISTIVLVLEHISISKAFARLNGYRVDPNQEFIAIGFSNMVGTFFGAYPVTGSFSRTALSAKCGVKTPLKSLFTGCCVLLAIYCFTSGFYYIPNATLCAIIIHCVTGLLSPYKLTAQLYMFSPVDFVIFIVGVFIAVFSAIENGIYWAICASCAQILWRMSITNGTFLGRVKVAKLRNPHVANDKKYEYESDESVIRIEETSEFRKSIDHTPVATDPIYYEQKWVPLRNESLNPSPVHTRYINNQINIEAPPAGVVVYRLAEDFIYTNCSSQFDQLVSKVKSTFRPHNSEREKLWCEYFLKDVKWSKPTKISQWFEDKPEVVEVKNDHLPVLRVIHLDFSQVVAVDATSVQTLIDLQRTVCDFVGDDWELHFSGIINPWVIRSLVNAGFGSPVKKDVGVLTNRYIKGAFGFGDATDVVESNHVAGDLEVAVGANGISALHDVKYPYFYNEIPSYSQYE